MLYAFDLLEQDGDDLSDLMSPAFLEAKRKPPARAAFLHSKTRPIRRLGLDPLPTSPRQGQEPKASVYNTGQSSTDERAGNGFRAVVRALLASRSNAIQIDMR